MNEGSHARIEIFDPPLCCPTGLCGPVIDPALLDISEALLRLGKELSGQVQIDRYLLSQQPGRFMQNPDVARLLKERGVGVLPVTVVNGRVLKTEAYPSYDELRAALADGRTGGGGNSP